MYNSCPYTAVLLPFAKPLGCAAHVSCIMCIVCLCVMHHVHHVLMCLCVMTCRSAPLVLKHCSQVAQVIAASKQQGPSFARQPTDTATPSATQATLVVEQSPVLRNELTISGLAAGEPSSSFQQQALDGAAVFQSPAPQSPGTATSFPAAANPSSAAAVASPAPAASPSPLSPIKPRALKPIALARGSSAFLGQPKRPALGHGLSQASPLAPNAAIREAAPVAAGHPSATRQLPASGTPAITPESALTSSSIDDADHQQLATKPMTSAAAKATAAEASAVATATPVLSVLGSASQPSAMGSAFTRQSRAAPQIRPAGSGMFGSKTSRADPSALPQGSPAATGPSDKAGPSQEADLAAVNRLRAQFTLPFATAPAQGQMPAAKAGKRQQPEGQELLDKASNGASTSEGIRAVVDALQADTPSEAAAGAASQPVNKRHKGSFQTAQIMPTRHDAPASHIFFVRTPGALHETHSQHMQSVTWALGQPTLFGVIPLRTCCKHGT